MASWTHCLVAVCYFATAAFAEAEVYPPNPYDSWDALLKDHVDPVNGRIDYVKLSDNEAKLKAFIDQYATMDFSRADDNEKKALYINLYNAGMMYKLLRYAKDIKKIKPSDSEFLKIEVNNIKVPGGTIWTWDDKFTVAGKAVTLDNIEHDLIRNQHPKEWGSMPVQVLDPRIHAAVNCAALSCPRVREKAYRPETADAMLEENIREFVNSEVQFAKAGESNLKANEIVKWYYPDFDGYGKRKSMKGAGDYLASFIDDKRKDATWMKAHFEENFNDRSWLALRASGSFVFFYNWQVNDQRNK